MAQSPPPWPYIARGRFQPRYRRVGDWLNRQPKNASSWIEGTTKSWLAVLGLLYLLGYVIWSVHAWHRGLGQLPALRAQYFIAGLVPLLLLSVLTLIVWGLAVLHGKASKRRIALISSCAFFGLLVIVLVAPYLHFLGDWPDELEWLRWVAFPSLLSFCLLSLAMDRWRGTRIDRWQWTDRSYTLALIVSAFALFAFAIVLYTRVIYERIPAAVGGVASHCEILYLKKDEVSPNLIQLIAPGYGTSVSVVQTKPVLVLFIGSENTRFKRAATNGTEDNRLFSIDNDAVAGSQSSNACDASAEG
jgi:hypothetical protein